MIFKEKNDILPPRVRELLKIPKIIVIKASRSGYINENILSDFLLLECKSKEQLIISDVWSTHKTKRIEEIYCLLDAKVIYIPGGCTKYLQPLDVIVISNFKRKAERYRIEYQINQEEQRSKISQY